MPYDGDQFFSTAQRLASTCTHRSERKWSKAQVKKRRTQTAKTTIRTHEHHKTPQHSAQHWVSAVAQGSGSEASSAITASRRLGIVVATKKKHKLVLQDNVQYQYAYVQKSG